MEHRWGRRTALWTAVRLRTGTFGASGRVRDASASGAFVETGLHVTAGSRVELEFRGTWIAACVVRSEGDGIGLEWHEFAPPAVVETLERLDELRELHADYGRNLPAAMGHVMSSSRVATPTLVNKFHNEGA